MKILRAALLVVVVVAVVALGVLAFPRETEPSYQGRTLTDWLDDYYYDSRERIEDDSPQTEAYLAIRAIGTNALPTLLRWVEHEPSPLGERLRSVAASLPSSLANLGFVQKLEQWGRRPDNWPQAFQVLGAEANSAVPELTRLLHAPAVENDGLLPTLALAYIGPAGLPPLLAAVADPNAACRINAISAVGDMGTNAFPAIPLLIQSLSDRNLHVARAATRVLCEKRLRPDIVLPALAKCLQSPDPETRILAAAWLAEVKAYRSRACRVLRSARQDPSKEVRSFAESSIEMLPHELEEVPSPAGEQDLRR